MRPPAPASASKSLPIGFSSTAILVTGSSPPLQTGNRKGPRSFIWGNAILDHAMSLEAAATEDPLGQLDRQRKVQAGPTTNSGSARRS